MASEVCSVHGKKRTMQNLTDDGAGGFCCVPGFECNTGERLDNRTGDWACAQCGDHQFARNSHCRKCGAEKPANPTSPGSYGSYKSWGGGDLLGSMKGMMGKGMMPGKKGCAKGCGKNWGPSTGSGASNNQEKQTCSVHGKLRSLQNLADDGVGGFCCVPGFECNTGERLDVRTGDWACSQCGDHQFAKNTHCRGCGAPKPENPIGAAYSGVLTAMKGYVGGKGAAKGGDSAGYGAWGKGAGAGDNQMCSVHGKVRSTNNMIEDGAGGWMCCAPNECKVGNPGGGPMPGDWSCPACGDHQFARNPACRKCGAPKPADAGFAPY